jgi:hypothetical protein
MLINLVGVIEDGAAGAARSTDAPADPRVTVRIPRGTDVTLAVKILLASGPPLDAFAANQTLTLTVRKRPGDPVVALTATGTASSDENAGGGPGVFLITITAAATRNMFGRHFYDLWLSRGIAPNAKRDAVIPLSPFVVEDSLMVVP